MTEMLQEKIALLNDKEPLILLDTMDLKAIYFLQELLKDNVSVKIFVIWTFNSFWAMSSILSFNPLLYF